MDYEFIHGWKGMTPSGLPHSEISGSMCVCHYPKLIAAYHVLRRLAVPRHPSCALIRLVGNKTGKPPQFRGRPSQKKLYHPFALRKRRFATLFVAYIQFKSERKKAPKLPSFSTYFSLSLLYRLCSFQRTNVRSFFALSRMREALGSRPKSSGGKAYVFSSLLSVGGSSVGGRAWNRTRDLILIRDAL